MEEPAVNAGRVVEIADDADQAYAIYRVDAGLDVSPCWRLVHSLSELLDRPLPPPSSNHHVVATT